MSIRSKLYSYELVKSAKNRIRPVKHLLFGKNGIYWVMDEVARGAGGADKVKTIFDVGAATGEYALHFLKKFPKATIYCFEPLPAQFEQLQRRMKNFGDRVQLFNFGLYNHEGEATFYEAPYKDASSVIEGRGMATTVMMRRLDEVIKELPVNHIDFIKIDVEGVEREVIEGGMKTLGDMVDNAFIEIQPSFKNYNGDHLVVFERLERLGLKFVGCFEDYFFSKKVG